MHWAFVLTDADYIPRGEIQNAYERQVSIGLNGVPTLSFTIRMDNPLAAEILAMGGYIKAYRHGTLEFFGPIVTLEENAERNVGTIAVNAAGAAWILNKRLAGQTAAGVVVSSLTDRAVIVKNLIDAANAVTNGETGIRTTGSISAASAITYEASPFKPISEVLLDVSATLDGFDWRFDPLDNWDSETGTVTSQKIADFTAAAVLGSAKSEAIFEWGTGKANIASYRRSLSREGQANKVFHIHSAGPDAPGYPTVSSQDTTSQTTWGLMEALAQADIHDAGLRQSLTDEHVRVRKNPRTVIDFTPHVTPHTEDDADTRMPRWRTDYFVGDIVRGRAAYHGVTRFDAALRVWGVTFQIDQSGSETVTLKLSDET